MKPPLDAFTPRERKIVKRCTSPYRVQQFLNGLPYNQEKGGETLRTFRGVVRHRYAHCLEAALSAAAILEQHGYPTLLMDLESWDDLDHVLFLYESGGKWGTVARSRDPGLHGRKPVFKNLRDLVDSYAEPYIDATGRIIGFGVLDLADLASTPWRFSEGNVWRVQKALIEMDHRRYHMADRRYAFWFERFKAYKKRYPNRKPRYFDNKSTWTAGYPKVP
jgi:hypothetical protein